MRPATTTPTNLVLLLAPCTATIASATAKLGLLNDKTNGIEVNAQDLSKKLSAALHSAAVAEQEFGVWLNKKKWREGRSTAERDAIGVKVKKFVVALRGVRTHLEFVLKAIEDLGARLKKCRKACKKLGEALPLERDKLPDAVHMMAALFPLAAAAGLSVLGFAVDDFAPMFQDLEEPFADITGTFGAAADSAGQMQDWLDQIKEKVDAPFTASGGGSVGP